MTAYPWDQRSPRAFAVAGTENLVDLRMVETIAVLEESTRYKGKKVVVVVIVVVVDQK